MVESSWSDSQSTLTTELGSAVDSIDTPRRRCVVPKVRPRQRNGSDDQEVPEYWDQTVPVWSCKEAGRRTKRKLNGDSVCRHGQNSRRFGGGASGATMVGRDTAVKRCCSEVEREHSAGETTTAPASEVQVTVAMLISPASPVLVTSRRSGVSTKHPGCEICNQLCRGPAAALATTLGRTHCTSHCGMSFKTSDVNASLIHLRKISMLSTSSS